MVKHKLYLYLIVIVLFGRFEVSSAQTVDSNSKISKVENNLLLDERIIFADSVVKRFNIYERMKYYKVPSISIAVINEGKLEWAKAYGLAGNNEKRNAGVNTLYQAASISKSINAYFIMKLYQEGKLSLNKDIRGYLKSWTFPDNDYSKGKTITIKNLLSHTAGLNLHGFKGYSFDEKIPTINNILDGQKPANNEALIPVYEPEQKMEYSGGGTVLTRKIIEDNISANYDSLIKTKVLQPLGMYNSTYIDPLNSGVTDFAAAYNEKMEEIPGKYNLYPELAPDGLWTNPTELAKFIISIQQSYNKQANSFLNFSNVNEMLTPVIPNSNSALGVFINDYGSEKYFMHEGANNGFRTIFLGSLTSGKGIVIMVNSDNGKIIKEIINSVADVYGWKEIYNPEIRKILIIPDSIAENYIGVYSSENPKIRIKVALKNNSLHLTTRGDDNLEKMLFVSNRKFYLPSSPNTFAEFISGETGVAETLIVAEDNNIIFKAVKQKDTNSESSVFPDINWEYIQNPVEQGWDIKKLDALKKYIIDSTCLTGFMIVQKGKVVFDYGNIQENSYIASCRKSILSMLMGKYVNTGIINLGSSIKDLGINDIGLLLPSEKESTIKDIISARSGVFHPAGNPGDNFADAPERGSVKPGEYWLYNNWDFNVAGYIFEKLSGKNIYDEIESTLAGPLLMQDWKKELQKKEGDETKSMFLSYPMWFSTRDMARIGLLMLNKGKWNNKQIIEENWINEMIKPRTSYIEVNNNIPDFRNSGYYFGYGYMWWLWQNISDERFKGGYSAFGSMGQTISVFPNAELVIVYKTNDIYQRETPLLVRLRVISLVFDALEKDNLNK